MILHILLLIAVVLFSLLAILLRDLLKSAISLAVASIFLSIIFFMMNAPYIAVFEISVVAGLITVLFISTVALVKKEEEVKESKLVNYLFPVFFVLFIIIDIFVMKSLIGRLCVIKGPSPLGNFSQVFWKERTFDLIGQIGIIFAGVFAVIALFRKVNSDKDKDNHE
jgi:NADH-quinone oxidoreductase subunit J